MPQKKLKTKKSLVTARGFGIILEDINKTVHQVLKGHEALDLKFDELKEDIGILKVGHKALAERVDEVAERVESMDRRFTKNFEVIMEYLSRIDEEIQELKKVLFRKADIERLEVLEKRVVHVELVVKKFYEGKDSN